MLVYVLFTLIGTNNLAESLHDKSNYQDEFTNSLIKLDTFTFYPIFHSNKEETLAIEKIILKELKEIFNVETIDIQSKEHFMKILPKISASAAMIYQVNNITDIENKELNIIKASLRIKTEVIIEATKEVVNSSIWIQDKYLSGQFETQKEKIVKQTLSLLLDKFMKDYSFVNKNQKSNKPKMYYYHL